MRSHFAKMHGVDASGESVSARNFFECLGFIDPWMSVATALVLPIRQFLAGTRVDPSLTQGVPSTFAKSKSPVSHSWAIPFSDYPRNFRRDTVRSTLKTAI
jgi:hypothetical protein